MIEFPDKSKRRARARWNLFLVREAAQACIRFANEHEQQFPTSVAEVAPNLTGGVKLEEIETNSDIVYQDSMAGIANPSRTIVIMSKQAWQERNGRWLKAYAFADGRGVVREERENNFDIFEGKRIILSTSNQ
jgi:hypothetical protein